MISFNGQYPLKLLLWGVEGSNIFFLIRFINWMVEIWRKYFPHKWKKFPHVEMPSQTHEPPAIIIISDNYRGAAS